MSGGLAHRRAEIGIGLQGDKAPGAYGALAAEAEAGGVDVVSVFGDLMFQPALPALLEIAAATSRVRVGAACFNPYTVHPVEIAGQIAALDAASTGRAYLGLARGAWLGAIGIDQRRPLAALREAAALIAALLSGDSAGISGDLFPLAPGTVLRYPVHRRRVPLLIGTWGRRGGELAGRIADEVKIGGCANPAMVPVMRSYIAAGAAAAGRDPDDVDIVVGAVTVVDEDGARARAKARSDVAMYLDVVAELDPTLDVPHELLAQVRAGLGAGDHEVAGRAIPDDVIDRFAFSGTPEHVAALANAVIAAGASRVEFGTPHGLTDAHGVALVVSRVLPLIERSSPVSSKACGNGANR